MDYEIDAMSAASPEMDDAEFAALKASIAEIGQLVSIVTVGGKIIDGRKRYRACLELGKAPAVIELPIGADPVEHALALNLLRTQYTASQRAMYAATVATRSRADSARKTTPTSVMMAPTILEAAKAAGVAQSMVIDAKAIRRRAIPDVVSAVEQGDLTVHTALQIAAKPKHEQLGALTAVVSKPKGRDGRRISNPRLADGHRPRLRRWGDAELADRAIGVLVHSAQELNQVMDGVSEIPDVVRRLDQLDDVATTIRKAREILKRRVTEP